MRGVARRPLRTLALSLTEYRMTRHESPDSYRADLHDLGFDDEFVARAELFDHLLSAHDVLMTTDEWTAASSADLRALDPCCGGDAA